MVAQTQKITERQNCSDMDKEEERMLMGEVSGCFRGVISKMD